jgi:hypothetical protein
MSQFEYQENKLVFPIFMSPFKTSYQKRVIFLIFLAKMVTHYFKLLCSFRRQDFITI